MRSRQRSWIGRALAAVALGLGASCFTLDDAPSLTRTQLSPDYPTYSLRRVGLLPFDGPELNHEHAETLQRAFLLELGHSAPFEIVRLGPADLAEITDSEPYRRGIYQPRTLLDLAARFRLDAVFIGTVTQVNVYPPQVLGLDLDLVSCETGMVLWNSSLHMDASDANLRRHLESFQRSQATNETREGGKQLVLISPSRFARFAAHEVAKGL